MDFIQKLDDLTERIAVEFNSFNTKRGPLSSLPTTDKSSVVAALIELSQELTNIEESNIINDAINSSVNFTWSITQIKIYVGTIIDALFSGVPVEHDSILKISTYLLNVEASLSNYVSYNQLDLKSGPQKQQARDNIDAPSISELDALQDEVTFLKQDLGNLNRDFVLDFTNEL